MQTIEYSRVDTLPMMDFAVTEWLMEELSETFMETFWYLFPEHARALPTGYCSLAVSWAMQGDPHAANPYATPITVRFEPDLIDALRAANPDGRRRIFRGQDNAMRAGMLGYNPYGRWPQSRVIVLG